MAWTLLRLPLNNWPSSRRPSALGRQSRHRGIGRGPLLDVLVVSRRRRLASFERQSLDQVCTVIIVYSFACTGHCCNTLPLCRTCSWAWLHPACSLALCQPHCFTLTSCPSPPPFYAIRACSAKLLRVAIPAAA